MPEGILTLAAAAPKIDTGNTAFMLLSSALVLLMTPGLAFFYGGMVRVKSVLNMLMMSFISIAIITILWTLYGFSIAFDTGNGFLGGFDWVGMRHIGLTEPFATYNIPIYAFAVFQLMFAIITPALISGALADRVKIVGLVGLHRPVGHPRVLPRRPLGLGADHGLAVQVRRDRLRRWYRGPHQRRCRRRSAPSWSSASASASRRTRCGRTTCRSSCSAPVCCGSAGSASTPAPGSATTTASARSRSPTPRSPPPPPCSAGSPTSASSTAPSPPSVPPPARSPVWSPSPRPVARSPARRHRGRRHRRCRLCAAAVGLKYKFNFDDSLDVVGVHLVGGIVGSLLIGLFATGGVGQTAKGLFYGGGLDQLGKQFVGVGAVLGYSLVVSAILAFLIDKTIGFTVTEDVEVAGIDQAEHAETAYDFSGAGGGLSGGTLNSATATKKVDA
jgi:hypothetical protein